MEINDLTGAERVIYKTHYEFAINVLKLAENEAQLAAKEKIRKKRKLAKQLPRY